MSFQYIRAAFQTPVGNSARKLVLVALAERADNSGRCYPGIADIVRRTELGDKTVRRHLEALEAQGLTKRSRRWQQSTVYQLASLRMGDCYRSL